MYHFVWLHGLGQEASYWESALQNLAEELGGALSVVPVLQAPSSPVEALGKESPNWFPMPHIPLTELGIQAQASDAKLTQSVEVVIAEIRKMSVKPDEKVIVGGFSQGGALAMRVAEQAAAEGLPIAGAVNLAGWWLCARPQAAGLERKIPLLWYHGEKDVPIPVSLMQSGVAALRKLAEGSDGVFGEVSDVVNPTMGHNLDNPERFPAELVQWVQSIAAITKS